MNALWMLISAVASFAIAGLLGKWLVPFLHKLKYGQTILDIGPKWHKSKQGTPVMGGIMFIVSSVIVTVIVALLYSAFADKSGVMGEVLFGSSLALNKVLAGLALAVGNGAIGFVDDYTKVVKKRNLGLTAKQKLLLQFLVAAAYLFSIYLMDGGSSATLIPFVGTVDLGWAYWIISAILIVGVVNAVNLSDGVDGLVGSMTFFASLAFMIIACTLSFDGIGIMAASLAGGCLGFLLWNFHPAKVFMGDTGSLYLGGFLCALAFALNMPVLIIPIALVYIFEMFSVILQVAYFKLTHGKRLFKMSPIHHHFEMCGWSEVKIVTVFSIATAVMGAAALLCVVFGF
ncbi:MAG: phospho-N-acetylmuramoyl-pentapeptide-transferase [Acutalibacteraceae bacterium]